MGFGVSGGCGGVSDWPGSVLTVGSLFAGVGGFDIAAERAGMEVAWQSEVDKHASQVLEHHWPGRNLGDIHNIRMETGNREARPRPAATRVGVPAGRGRRRDERHETDAIDTGGTDGLRIAAGVDVLTGGFPCQDYSVAGKRGGLAGDRGALWWEYHRLIAEGRPDWVVGENVPGLISSNDGRDFRTIIDSLVGLGYGVVWRILDAQYFGVAQRRRRVFIVGHSGGRPRPEVLALGEGLFGDSAPSRGSWEAASVDAASGVGGGGGHQVMPFIQNLAFDELNSVVSDDVHHTLRAGTKQSTGVVAFAQNQRDEVRDLNDTAGALAAEPGMKQQTYVTHPSVRRLTPLECERLQGFPDGWTDTPGNSDTQRYRQMGNAVAVPVVEWIMRRIGEAQ